MKLLKLVLLFGAFECILASKILLLSVFPGKSHWLTFEHIIRELISRGHEVTAVTNYKFKTDNPKYTGILIDPPFNFENGFPMKEYFVSTTHSNPFHKIYLLWTLGLITSRHAFESASIKKFMKSENLTFDLVISEQFFQESWLMFAHKYQAPILTINTLEYTSYIDSYMGLLTSWSFVPHYMSGYNDEMNFMERSFNVLISLTDMLLRRYFYLPGQKNLAKEYFTDLTNLPAVEDLEKNISVILVNSHIMSSVIRPKIAGMVDIAGVHIRAPKELPQNIKTFLDEADKGVIYINFGTYLSSSEMPTKTLETFLQVFSNMPDYRFLWKWESDIIPNIPKNVLLQKWIPQNDVLAHRNIKVFVTHGGIFGTQESIYHARPMLFVPFYGDQHGNAIKFCKAGVGQNITISSVSAEDFQNKISELIDNPMYQKNINKLSQIFRDNPTDPLEESIFWIEYVIRYNGATHLKTAAVNIPWYKYLMLDVLGFWMAVSCLTSFIFMKLFKLCLSSCKGKHEKVKTT